MVMFLFVFGGMLFLLHVTKLIACYPLFWVTKVLTLCYFPMHLYSLPPHVFESTYFVHNLALGLDKISARSIKCVFLGYTRLQKDYRCFFPLRRYLVSTDVTFFNNVPFLESPILTPSPIFEVLPLPPIPMPPAPIVPLPSLVPELFTLVRLVQVYCCRVIPQPPSKPDA